MSTTEQHLQVPQAASRLKMGKHRTSTDTSSPSLPQKSPPMSRGAVEGKSEGKSPRHPERRPPTPHNTSPPKKAAPTPPSRLFSQIPAAGLTCTILSKDDLNVDDETWLSSPVKFTKVESGISAKDLEARVALLQKWQHPSITQFYGVSLEPEVMLVTEAGSTLNDYLAMNPSGLREKTAIALDLARGLYFLGAKGVTPQVLRPENILITPQGQAKLVEVGSSTVKDFGSILWFLFSQQAPVPAETLDEYPQVPKKFAEWIKACWSSDSAKQPTWKTLIEELKVYQSMLALSPEEFCQRGQQLEQDGDFKAAYDAYFISASAGYFYGQSRLGTLLLEGKGCKKDFKQAFFWMLASAKQGKHARSQFTVGMMYENGDGTVKNINEAIYWYRKAAENGSESATKALARFGAEVGLVGGSIPYSFVIPEDHIKRQEPLGQGGFGVVYRAIWSPTSNAQFPVVVKQLKESTLSKEAMAEFEKEVKLQIQFDSPGIVKVYGVMKDGMVMEYMEQGSLQEFLKSKSREELPWKVRLDMALNLAQALEYLHAKNIVHRDLKSANIVINAQGVAKITDFGLSKVREETKTKSVAPGSQKTIEGSYLWLSPELLKMMVKFSKSADIYAFAIILWELAALQLPYPGLRSNMNNLTEFVLGGGRETFDDERTPGVPKGYPELVTECWDQDPTKRCTAKQMATRLSNLSLVPTIFAPVVEPQQTQTVRKRGGTCIETSEFSVPPSVFSN